MGKSISSTANRFTRGACPVTNVIAPNMTRTFTDFHISYNPSSADYGCDTTALVLSDRVFFILNGDFSERFAEASESKGLQGCIDLFIENIEKANRLSEHLMASGMNSDPFELGRTAREMLGQDNIDRIVQAVKAG